MMTSGYGQFYTNEPGAKNPQPYLTIGFDAIRNLVDNPQQVDKTQAQWLIPSSYPSRDFKAQEINGQYYALWADLDKNPPTLHDLAVYIDAILGGADYEVYNSRSATVDNQKARVLIFLDKPLCYADWSPAQQHLNDMLEVADIIPDRANERAAQLCYLPNKGAFYGSLSRRDGQHFDPVQFWASRIAAKREKLESDAAVLEVAKQTTMAKREALKLSDAPDLIGAFNLAYTPQDWLLKAGYAQKGDSFRHPDSETGNYSATVRQDDNGVWRVNTLSSSDPLYTAGGGAHDAFSTYTTLSHGGDKSAALKAAGNELLTIGCESWNKAKQIEYAKNNQRLPAEWTAQLPPAASEIKQPFNLSSFSISGKSKEMELKMLADKYVLDKIAILGQATTIYAKPNTGKTLLVLWMLVQSINNETIVGKDVFYINADDDYKGLVFKTSLAEKYGFEMLAPGHNGFESQAMQGYMRQMIDDDTARGKVVILDTLKKFTDLMNKKSGSEFMTRAREFVLNGGTLIMLAHTNKNRDINGKAMVWTPPTYRHQSARLI